MGAGIAYFGTPEKMPKMPKIAYGKTAENTTTVDISNYGFISPPVVVATAENTTTNFVNVRNVTTTRFTLFYYFSNSPPIYWIAIGE